MNDYSFISAPQLKRDPLDSAMKAILSTTDRSLAESARLTLQAEGIAVVIEDASGSALPFIPASVLVREADYQRAREVLHDLVPSSFDVVHGGRWYYRSLKILAVVLVLLGIIVCGTIFLR